MLSAGVESLEKRHFDILCSSVSAVVRELYAGLPVPPSAELPALPHSTGILDVKTKTSAFVLSCNSLPSGHQRTHGLTVCPQGAAKKLACVGKGSGPGLMDLPSKEPAGAAKHVEDGEGQHRNLVKMDSLQDCVMENAGLASSFGDVAVESLVQYSLISAEAQWPREEEHWPVHEGREPFSTRVCMELEDLLQGLEGGQADAQEIPETLSDPMKEAAGMKADGARLFSKAGEHSAQGGLGATTRSRQSSETGPGPARGEVSGTDTFAAREPVSIVDGATGKGQRQGEEEGHGLTARGLLSATQGLLSSSEAGEENFLCPDEQVNAPPQNQMNLYDNTSSVLVLESKRLVGALQQSDTSFEAMGLHFQDPVESGHLMWEENVDICEVLCEMEEESLVDEEENWSHASFEHVVFVEELASGATTEETLLHTTWNDEEFSADSSDQQGVGFYTDHSYSCMCRAAVDVQERDSVRCSWKEVQAVLPLEPGSFADPFGQFALAQKTHSENNNSSLLSTLHLLSGKQSEENSRPGFSGIVPTSPERLHGGTKLAGERLPELRSNGRLSTEVFMPVSATQPRATHRCSLADVALATSNESTRTIHLCDAHPSAQQADMDSSRFQESPSTEKFSGSRAKQGDGHLIQSTGALSPVSQNCNRGQRRAHPAHGNCMNAPCSTPGTCCALSEGICLDGDDCDGVEGSHATSTDAPEGSATASVCAKEFPPEPGSSGGGGLREAQCFQLGSKWEGAEGASGHWTAARSEDIWGINTGIVPPITDQEEKSVQNPLFVHANENINYVDGQSSDRPAVDRDLDKHSHAVKSVRLGKYCGKGQHGRGPGALLSSLSDHCAWKDDCSVVLKHLCSPSPTREKNSRGKIQFLTNCYRILFNQKIKRSGREVLNFQETPLMISKEPQINWATQTVTSLSVEAQKSVICNASYPPAELLRDTVCQEMFQQSTQSKGPFRKELVSKQLKKESVAFKDVSLCPEWASDIFKLNRVLMGLAQAAADEFCSASETVTAGLSGFLGKNVFLQVNRKPAVTASKSFLWPDSITFAAASSQNSPAQECLGNVEASPLTWIHVGVQLAWDTGLCLSPGVALSTSSSPHVLCFPTAKEHPVITASFERVASYHAHKLISGNDRTSWAVQGSANVDPVLESKKIALYTVGSMLRVDIMGETGCVIFSSLHPSEEIKLSMGDEEKEGIVTTERMEFLVPFLYDSKNPSGVFFEGLKFPVQGEEITLPFKIQVQMRPSFLCVSEHISGFILRNVEGPKKPPFVQQKVTYALQTEFPTISSPELFCCSLFWESLGGNRLEAPASCLASKGRSFQSAKSSQDLAGAPQRGCLFPLGSGAEVEKVRRPGTGHCLPLTPEEIQGALQTASQQGARRGRKEGRLLKRRSLPLGQPWNRSLHERSMKSEDGAPQTFAISSSAKDSEDANLCGALRAKRPRITKDVFGLENTGAQGPGLDFRSHSCLPVSQEGAAAFCSLSFPLGFPYARSQGQKRRELHLLKKQPGTACKRMPVRGQTKAAKNRRLMGWIAFVSSAPEIVSQYKCRPTESPFFARTPRAPGKEGAVDRYSAPKRSGSQSSLLVAHRPLSPTKDPACTQRPFAVAPRLLMPPSSHERAKRPGKLRQPQRKLLLEASPRVQVKPSSQWSNRGGSCFRIFGFQSPALCPIKPTPSTHLLESGTQTSLPFGAPAAWASFHLQVNTGPTSSLVGVTTPGDAPHRVVLGERGALDASWRSTFSFLLSQSCWGLAPVQRDAWILAGPSITLTSLSAAKGEGNNAVARRSPGCARRGLQTALALFSPGCYRVWTRKRNLKRCIPPVQKVTVLQFTRGLKGLKRSTSVSADLFSSLPCSLGRVLSIWSQHGPPSCPSEFSALHPKRCKWQPLSTASTSLGCGNSCAMVPQMLEQLLDAPKATNDVTREPSFAASLPTSCSIPEAVPSPLGFPAPEFQIQTLDEPGGPAPALPSSGKRPGKAESEKRLKKVSQIRIRKTVPKPDPNLTPMGLPRPKRLKKTEFSLEEIYTNKNYKSPPSSRSLETIFEEPKEKNGSLISVSQQKRKRVLEFQDFTIPRKRKARSRVKVMGSSTRAQKAALEGRELDVLLVQKLTDLETFFAKEEEREKASSS